MIWRWCALKDLDNVLDTDDECFVKGPFEILRYVRRVCITGIESIARWIRRVGSGMFPTRVTFGFLVQVQCAAIADWGKVVICLERDVVTFVIAMLETLYTYDGRGISKTCSFHQLLMPSSITFKDSLAAVDGLQPWYNPAAFPPLSSCL